MAKITFLGTAGDAYVLAKQLRSGGGIVIDLEGNRFVLDPGPGTLAAAKECELELRSTVAVLVTHAHLGHSGELNALLNAMSLGGMDPHGVLLASDSVLLGGHGISPAVSEHHSRLVERAIGLGGVPRVGVNEVHIQVLPAHHNDSTAVGFALQGESERISYTGDTGLTQEVMDAHQGSSVLVANMTLPAGSRDQHRLSVDDVIELARSVKPATLVLTHFGHDLLKEDLRALGRQVGKDAGCKVIVAEDGLVLDSATYR